MEYRKYEVWHDESKIGGYHHGILFAPIDKKEEVNECKRQIDQLIYKLYGLEPNEINIIEKNKELNN